MQYSDLSLGSAKITYHNPASPDGYTEAVYEAIVLRQVTGGPTLYVCHQKGETATWGSLVVPEHSVSHFEPL